MKRYLGWVSLFLVAVSFSPVAYAGDRYYMVLFAVQDRLNHFVTAHTFAAFAHADDAGGDPASYPLTVKVISWLPDTGGVYLFKAAQRGRNFPLLQSIAEPVSDGRFVTKWGPVEISAELFERAATRSEQLDRREIQYKAIDNGLREAGIAANCEHAVSDVDTDHGFLPTGTGHGDRGTQMVARHLSRWIVGGKQPNLKWLEERLGLTKFPIRHGKW